MMHCIEGEKEELGNQRKDREGVHADCIWVGLRPTIDAEIVANERMWESTPTQMLCKAAPAFVQDHSPWPCDLQRCFVNRLFVFSGQIH